MVRRHVLTVSILFFSALLLTQFQNCGPAPVVFTGPIENTGDVRLVDDLGKTTIQFYEQNIQIYDQALETGLRGLCNRSFNGAKIRWQIRSGKGSEASLAMGSVECRSGQFNIEIQDLGDMVCGVEHLIEVEGEWGDQSFAYFSRRCEPLASEPLPAPSDSPYGTFCNLEFHAIEEGEGPCVQVCYRDDKMVFSTKVDRLQCSGLASKLAGQ